jgi:hypothetical protein
MNFLSSVIIGVLSSLAASIVFLFFLTRLRPKLVISEAIAKATDAVGNPVYSIKVVNKHRRSMINIKAQLQLISPTNAPGGLIKGAYDIILAGDNPLEISKYKGNQEEENYAYRFTIREDLDKIWEDDRHSYLRFAIFATDSLSGFARVFSQEYRLKRISLKEGDFVRGHGLEIM